jgi:hypothetical protein
MIRADRKRAMDLFVRVISANQSPAIRERSVVRCDAFQIAFGARDLRAAECGSCLLSASCVSLWALAPRPATRQCPVTWSWILIHSRPVSTANQARKLPLLSSSPYILHGDSSTLLHQSLQLFFHHPDKLADTSRPANALSRSRELSRGMTVRAAVRSKTG